MAPAGPWRQPPPNDEELARAALTGTLAHQAIGLLLQLRANDRNETPTAVSYRRALAQADNCLGEAQQIEARAHRQVLASAIYTYFQFLLPPNGWSFLTLELPLAGARADLAWHDAEGRILLDELKTGRVGAGLDATAAQVQRYLKAASDRFGADLQGVRVLCTGQPARSWLSPPRGAAIPLVRTGLVERPSRIRRLTPHPSPAGRPANGPRDPPPWLAAESWAQVKQRLPS